MPADPKSPSHARSIPAHTYLSLTTWTWAGQVQSRKLTSIHNYGLLWPKGAEVRRSLSPTQGRKSGLEAGGSWEGGGQAQPCAGMCFLWLPLPQVRGSGGLPPA